MTTRDPQATAREIAERLEKVALKAPATHFAIREKRANADWRTTDFVIESHGPSGATQWFGVLWYQEWADFVLNAPADIRWLIDRIETLEAALAAAEARGPAPQDECICDEDEIRLHMPDPRCQARCKASPSPALNPRPTALRYLQEAESGEATAAAVRTDS